MSRGTIIYGFRTGEKFVGSYVWRIGGKCLTDIEYDTEGFLTGKELRKTPFFEIVNVNFYDNSLIIKTFEHMLPSGAKQIRICKPDHVSKNYVDIVPIKYIFKHGLTFYVTYENNKIVGSDPLTYCKEGNPNEACIICHENFTKTCTMKKMLCECKIYYHGTCFNKLSNGTKCIVCKKDVLYKIDQVLNIYCESLDIVIMNFKLKIKHDDIEAHRKIFNDVCDQVCDL